VIEPKSECASIREISSLTRARVETLFINQLAKNKKDRAFFSLFYVPGIMQQTQLVVRLRMNIREVILWEAESDSKGAKNMLFYSKTILYIS